MCSEKGANMSLGARRGRRSGSINSSRFQESDAQVSLGLCCFITLVCCVCAAHRLAMHFQLILSAALLPQPAIAGPQNVVIVAAVGASKSRPATNTTQILANLAPFEVENWDCIALFWSTPLPSHDALLQRCQGIVASTWKWASLLGLADGLVQQHDSYRAVCIMLDDLIVRWRPR